MSAAADPYVRVYYGIVDDPKFATVYDDDHHLATWLRLLLTADATYPATPPMPANVRKASVVELVRVGLVETAPGNRYRIHGLESERAKKSAVGRAGASARWNANAMPTHSERNAVPSSQPMHSAQLSSTQLNSAQRAREGLPNVTEMTQQVGESLTLAPILTAGQKQLTELDRLLERHGPDKVHLAMEAVAGIEQRKSGNPPTWVQLIYGTRNRLEPLPTAADSRASEKVDREAAERAAFDRTVAQTRARARELTQP